MDFCHEQKYELNKHRSVEELVLILKDWASVNMREEKWNRIQRGNSKNYVELFMQTSTKEVL